jgi:ankyrin repeat protein
MKGSEFEILRFLVEESEVSLNDLDIRQQNPFSVAIDKHLSTHRSAFSKSVQYLMNKGANLDSPDQDNQTPFLRLWSQSASCHRDNAKIILGRGAKVNQMSNQGMYALKISLVRREENEIKFLIDKGADINQCDHKGRNLLHVAINNSSSGSDATFETEQLLIDMGVNINKRDCFGRVPLHYAFVKIGEWESSDPIDPIETVSSLCARPDLEIEVPDKWHKTPLHYASQRSATISTLYILERGAEIESKDIYGNTPLGICLMHDHFNFGIILIQKKADVKVPVHFETPKRLEKKWKDEEKEQRRAQRRAQR